MSAPDHRMVERVARALMHEAAVVQQRTIGVAGEEWDTSSGTIQAYWSWLAAAAIKAMHDKPLDPAAWLVMARRRRDQGDA
jgi:hypothetical protein